MLRERIGIAGGFAGALVAVLLAAGLLNTALGPSVTYQADISYANAQVREQIVASSRYAADIGRADYLIDGDPSISTVYFYYDQTYPASYSTDAYWFGLSQLIVQLAAERGMTVHVVLLNAVELENYFQEPPATGSILVMASGVLPDTVFGPGLNDAIKWLRAGGVMIWAGDAIGAYSGSPSTDGNPPGLNPMGQGGIAQFLNLSYLGSGGTVYQNQSVYSSAFSFLYSLSLDSGVQFNVAGITADGGVALGPLAGNYTNLAAIPEGAGRLIDFSGPLWDLNALVQTLMNGIQSGAFLFSLRILGNSTVHLQANQQATVSVMYEVPQPNGNGSLPRFCSFAFQTGTFAQFTQLSCTSLG
jgi:hypothetical protein